MALGAAVALNLIGWNGTVADETQDSSDPMLVTASVTGGSITAGGAVSVKALASATISATTAAASVSVGISLTGGDDSGEEGEGGEADSSESGGDTGDVEEGEGGSSTSADEEGEGETATRGRSKAVSETPTDEGEADGDTVDEGADNDGGSETNEGEEGGAAAGESENTASEEGSGANGASAQKGSATSILSGLGQGGGLLVGLGGIVNSSQAGGSATPNFTTSSTTSVTDNQTLSTGQTVQLDSGFDNAAYSVGGGSSTQQVDPGKVINDSGTLYRYIGTGDITADLSTGGTPPVFTNASNWAQIGGTAGDTYEYIGPSNAQLDLNNQDYSNAALWTDITGGTSSGSSTSASSVPEGVVTATLGAGLGFLLGGSSTTPPSTSADEGEGGDAGDETDPDGANNPDEAGNATSADQEASDESGDAGSGTGTNGSSNDPSTASVAAAGVYTENKIATTVSATVSDTTTITTGSGAQNGLSVTAGDSAKIMSFDGAAAVSANFSDEDGEVGFDRHQHRSQYDSGFGRGLGQRRRPNRRGGCADQHRGDKQFDH